MCGYGMQQLGEHAAAQDVFTIGCLEKIVWWAKNNLLLVAGLTGGLLLLEVMLPTDGPVQLSERQDQYLKSASVLLDVRHVVVL